MAAARLVDELAKTSLGRYAVAVIGEEPRLAYNRVLLSSVLAGETGSPPIQLRPPPRGGPARRAGRGSSFPPRAGGAVAASRCAAATAAARSPPADASSRARA